MTGRELYGGLANTAYDSCYHLSCDNIYNINTVGFAQLARAAGYAAYKVRTHACSSSSSSESNCVALLATDESITRGCSSSKPRICLPTWLQALYNTLTTTSPSYRFHTSTLAPPIRSRVDCCFAVVVCWLPLLGYDI